ncbi:MAG: hypothetical protein IKB39_09600, partial [Bacteroidaceae bacterium]|nr:hypothetical protein [Bacteroidaceae bacterium]
MDVDYLYAYPVRVTWRYPVGCKRTKIVCVLFVFQPTKRQVLFFIHQQKQSYEQNKITPCPFCGKHLPVCIFMGRESGT